LKNVHSCCHFLYILNYRKLYIVNFWLQVHTSGHADINTLKQMVKAINPKYIVPIHTFHGSDYKDIFNTPVVELADEEDKVV